MENIEQQISKAIAAAGSTRIAGDGNPAEEVANECDRIKTLLKREFLSIENERLISRCFSFHQKSLIALVDQCTAARQAKSTEDLIGLESHMTDLLVFLEQQFPYYFDRDLKPPEMLKVGVTKEIKQIRESISSKFLGTSLEGTLLRIVFVPLANLAEEWPAFSYRKLYFLRKLEKRLLSIDLAMDDKDLLRQDFCRELIRINFNTEEFFEYYVGHISKTLSACETLSDRIEQISYFHKICSQEYCSRDSAFVAESLSISDRLAEWISQEMEYLKSKQQLRIPPSTNEDGLLKDFKVAFDLSVSHLACLLRAFIDAGVIQNKNTSELIRFVTKFVKTKKSEAISYDSFRMKFYNVETGTKDAVRKMLQSTLKYLNN